MIRLITAPTVRLVGKQVIDDEQLDAFLRDEGVEGWESSTEVAGQKLVEVAGRLCYKSYAKPRPGGNGAYLEHVLESGHGSVIEHCVMNFIITGVSRSFTHELVRHRAGWAYSQRSQRFCDEADFAAVVPPELADEVAAAREFIARATGDPGAGARDISSDMINMQLPSAAARVGLNWLNVMELSARVYDELADYLQRRDRFAIMGKALDRKQAREAARSVLPNAAETQIFVTANARALRHFVEMRGVSGVDREMRRVACEVGILAKEAAPNLFPDHEFYTADDGACAVRFEHHKV